MDLPSLQGLALKGHLNPKLNKYIIFPAAGYTVISGASSLIFTMDHGPLGMPPLYNHGHSDALSVTLSVNGRPMLVDPGTYRYNDEPKYRRYFKGTRAHNTVTVDGADQAVQETGFIWSHPFKSALVRNAEIEDGLIIGAIHDGYRRLSSPVDHYRTTLFFGTRCFLIKDNFTGNDIHDFELNFHLHPAVQVRNHQGWWGVEHGAEKIYIRLLDNADFNFIVGQENPPFGWFSPAYGFRIRSGVLSCLKRGKSNNQSFLTAICLGSPVNDEELQERARLL